MASDRLYNAGLQLISPPPEETLRRTSKHAFSPPIKRKRTQPQPFTTPNPRSRKLPKHPSPLTGSPTRSKSLPLHSLDSPTKPKRVHLHPTPDYFSRPLADLSPQPRSLLSARSSRRSATPIPPYDPPKDIFTPPKEVYVTPVTATIRVSKSSKRKSTKPSTSKKNKSTPAPIVVKLEMPDVDLNAPMPPPSPGDDPLLLSSSLEPSSTPTKPRTRPDSISFSDSDVIDLERVIILPPPRRTTSPTPALFKQLRFDVLPPSSPPEESFVDQEADLDITPVDMPFFDLQPNPNDDAWTDSDDDQLPILSKPPSEEGEGEYTGRWKEVLVKTKADPPSSATRCRIDEWGNPKSPFPLSLEKKPPSQLLRSTEPDLQVDQDDHVDPFDFSSIPDQLPLGQQARDMSPEPGYEDQGSVEADTTHYTVPLRVEEEAALAPGTPIQVDAPLPDEALERDPVDDAFKLMGNQPTIEETDMEDDHEVQPVVEPAPEAQEDGDGSSSDVDEEPDVVKITSADPRAAARAAAILKQHNYDCFTKLELKRRYSQVARRRSASPFGLTKGVVGGGVHKDKERRKTTGGMGVRGDQVYIPGSPATTLPNLLKDVEAEVSLEHSVAGSPNPFVLRHSSGLDSFKTPLPSQTSFSTPLGALGLTPKVPMTPGEMCYDPLTGERMWTKEEWKRLDACFTDERLQVGAQLGTITGEDESGLASVDLVNLEDVVKKFVEWMGGEEAVSEYGPDWSRENLMQRTRAIRGKQRKGNVAPPTMLPFSPMQSPASPWGFDFGTRKTMMEVPEFTPIRPRPQRVLQKREWTSVVPETNADSQISSTLLSRQKAEPTVSVKPVPPTLLAPRYSHLLEEAITVSQDLPQVSPPDVSIESQESDTVLEEPESDDSPTTLVEESEQELPASESSSPAPEPEPETLGKRVKGLIFSYLPTLKKPSATIKNLKRPRQPGLPLPPKEVLTKPRGPVVTPAREPVPKPIPPKNLVQLQTAPPVQPPASKIPKVVHPKQLVELHHVTPKVADGEKMRRVRERRSSGGSVKDLIKGFEDMDSQGRIETEMNPRGEVRRMKSIGEWRKELNGPVKPVWKP